MKQYFENLYYALTGRNPFQKEMDDLSARYATLDSEHTRVLRILNDLGEQLDVVEAKLAEAEREKEVGKQKEKSYQQLTENLRQHLSEKDETIRELHEYCGKCTTERDQKIADLKEDLDATLEQLQRVNKDIGREMMNTNLLAKTNAAMNDLCTAMEIGDTESMMQAVEYVEWSNGLSRIAQQHLIVLRRKNELEGRMTTK